MLTCFWSVKGGTGVSTCAALHALSLAGRAHPTLLVDLDGDQPAVLGVDDTTGPGLSDWLAEPARDPSAIDRIARAVNTDLLLLMHGSAPEVGVTSGDGLIAALAPDRRRVVVDAALGLSPPASWLLGAATQRFLVLRPCYLALRAARGVDPTPTGVVLLREAGRALGPADVESVCGAPVVAEIAVDPSIARAVDAGLARTRLAGRVRRTFCRLADVTA